MVFPMVLLKNSIPFSGFLNPGDPPGHDIGILPGAGMVAVEAYRDGLFGGVDIA